MAILAGVALSREFYEIHPYALCYYGNTTGMGKQKIVQGEFRYFKRRKVIQECRNDSLWADC